MPSLAPVMTMVRTVMGKSFERKRETGLVCIEPTERNIVDSAGAYEFGGGHQNNRCQPPKIESGMANTWFLSSFTGPSRYAYLAPGEGLLGNLETFRNGVLGQRLNDHFSLSFSAFVMILDACADAGATSRVSVRCRHIGVSRCGWGFGGNGIVGAVQVAPGGISRIP